MIKEKTPTDIYAGSDIDSSDDDQTIPYVGDSDTETITYATTPRDKRYEIYRKKAKKKALKRLAKKRAKDFKRIQNKNKKKTQILVPTNVPITSDDPIEILADPNVSTILLPQIKTEDVFNDITDPQIIWDKDNKDVIPLYDEDNKNLIPLEFDTDKIIMTDDGDVILTEPDNMQIEQKPLIASGNSITLPPEENMTDIISTRNIAVKRKNPDIAIGEIKKIKNETDISIKHPIFRKMEKQKKADDRLAKVIASSKPILSAFLLRKAVLSFFDKTSIDNLASITRILSTKSVISSAFSSFFMLKTFVSGSCSIKYNPLLNSACLLAKYQI